MAHLVQQDVGDPALAVADVMPGPHEAHGPAGRRLLALISGASDVRRADPDLEPAAVAGERRAVALGRGDRGSLTAM